MKPIDPLSRNKTRAIKQFVRVGRGHKNYNVFAAELEALAARYGASSRRTPSNDEQLRVAFDCLWANSYSGDDLRPVDVEPYINKLGPLVFTVLAGRTRSAYHFDYAGLDKKMYYGLTSAGRTQKKYGVDV